MIECEDWSGSMMLGFNNELQLGKGTMFLQLDYLDEDTISEMEATLHKVERTTRGLFHETWNRLRARADRNSHLGDRICLGHSVSGVFLNSREPLHRWRYGQLCNAMPLTRQLKVKLHSKSREQLVKETGWESAIPAPTLDYFW